MDGFKARQEFSEVRVVRSCLLTSSTDNPSSSGPSTTVESQAESMSTEWTNEKHSLYLKSMEASFVDELYESMELLGWCPEKKDLSLSKSSKQTRPNPSAPPPPPAQFKVLQSGCWQKIHFDSAAQSQPAKTTTEISSPSLLSNPWILHYKYAGKTRGGADHQPRPATVEQTSREYDSSDRKKAMARWGASTSKQFRSCRSNSSRRESQVCETEVSDQNFIDEDDDNNNNEGEKVKRIKTRVLDPCSARDQVVPLGKP